MRTSLNEIKLLEDYLLGNIQVEESLLLQAKLILHKEVREKLILQKKVYLLIQEYGRMKLKEELNEVHEKLFTEPQHLSFRKKIELLFKK